MSQSTQYRVVINREGFGTETRRLGKTDFGAISKVTEDADRLVKYWAGHSTDRLSGYVEKRDVSDWERIAEPLPQAQMEAVDPADLSQRALDLIKQEESIREVLDAFDALDLSDTYTIDQTSAFEEILVRRSAGVWKRAIAALEALRHEVAPPSDREPREWTMRGHADSNWAIVQAGPEFAGETIRVIEHIEPVPEPAESTETQPRPIRAYYFGCHRGPGHYLFDESMTRGHLNEQPDGRWSYGSVVPWDRIDGQLVPDNDLGDGVAKLHHKDGWTALAFWDRSVDTRLSSNSAFFVNQILSFEDMVTAAETVFPHIISRLLCPITQADG